MRRFIALGCMLTFVACAPSDQEDAPATTEMSAPASALAGIAGTWSMEALTESGDSVLVSYVMNATDNADGWTVTFPGRDPIPARVHMMGDSAMVAIGPYPSALRSDVNVSTETIVHMMDGQIMGTFVAHYDTMGPDSVLRGRHRGTRMQ